MFINEKTTINARRKDRMRAEAYLFEYQNQASLKNSAATEDYKKYMTKSLINRGFLFKNYDSVERMYKASLEELFSSEFKNLFLYDLTRDISGIYKDISNVTNMGPIGIYDFFSSVTTSIAAKYLPIFEPFQLDLNEINYNLEISEEEKREVIDSRDDKDSLPTIFQRLTDHEIETGPIEGVEYYTNPKLDDTFIWNELNPSQRLLGPQENEKYYKLNSETGEYELVTEFPVGYNYVIINNDEHADPLETYYYLDETTNSFIEVHDIEIFESNLVYYKRIECQVFDSNVNYFIQVTISNNYDTDSYEKCENLVNFETGRKYYVLILDYDNINLSEDELNQFKRKHIGAQVDKTMKYYLKDLLVTIKEIYVKYGIQTMVRGINYESDKFETTVVQIAYAKFLHVFAALAYTISISNDLTDECETKRCINEFISIGLSKVSKISDMVSSKKYFSDTIIEHVIPNTIKEKVFKRYKIESPIADNIDLSTLNTTILQAVSTLTENLIKYRSLLDYIDIPNEENMMTLMGYSVMAYVLFIEMLYNNAYLSKNKVPVVKSVQELLKRFEPYYNKIIPGKTLKEFIKLGDVE
jgi:hypothetical protein